MNSSIYLRRWWSQKEQFTRKPFIACLFLLPVAVAADGLVANCTQHDLETAMLGGGHVSFACDGTIVLTNTLTVTTSVVLDGTGHEVVLSGNKQVRIFEVQPGVSLGLVRLTVANGRTVGASGLSGGPAYGGGIYNNQGTVSITGCTLSNLEAEGGGGLDTSGNPNLGGPGFGGAVYNWAGTVTLRDSFVLECTARGGVAGGAPIGTSGEGVGGAIWSSNGTVKLTDTTLRGNRALGAQGILAGEAFGGAIFAIHGTIETSNCVFSANLALGGFGPGVQGRPGGAAGGATFVRDTVLRCFRTRFDRNSAIAGIGRYPGSTSGGAIQNGGTLLLADCELSANRTFNSADAAQGGALYNEQRAVLSGTTVVNNVAEGGVNRVLQTFYGLAGAGGGIFNAGTLACTNTTFEGNVAQGGQPVGCVCLDGPGQGGAFCNSGGTAYLAHVTFSRNQAISSQTTFLNGGPARLPYPQGIQGGALYSANGPVTLLNSLLAHGPSGSNCYGNVIDAGHNLSSDDSCAFTSNGSRNNVELNLSQLDDFGGPTRTVALLDGSPALDAAASADCPATDQRGVARPFGGGCDIGAFESAPPYSIRGRVLGWQPDGVQVSAGPTSASPSNGFYVLKGFAPANYLVVPSGVDRVFQPHEHPVSLVADVVGLDFLSFRTNGLTSVRSNQVVRFTFAGAPRESYELLSSPSLGSWDSVSPFLTDDAGLYQFVITLGPGLATRLFAVRKP